MTSGTKYSSTHGPALLAVSLLILAVALSVAPAFESASMRSLPLAEASPLWGQLLALIAGLLFRFRRHFLRPAGAARSGEPWPVHAPGLPHTR